MSPLSPIDKMVAKEEFNEFRREVLSGQDKMMTILQRLDQERIFAAEWISPVRNKTPPHTIAYGELRGRQVSDGCPWQPVSNGVRRIEAEVEKNKKENKKEIKGIKIKLAIS